MSTNYVRGRAKEYTVKKTLEAAGCTCTRSASSQGLWDVICVRADTVFLVQSKLTSTGSFSEDENVGLLRALPVPANVRKELWLYEAGKGLVEIRDLKEPKQDSRTAEGQAARERSRARATQMKGIRMPRRTEE